ncbi:hypothetical protein Q3A66_03880 [Hymenobacter sp. BT770]|uniref:hypothetical protein n=1 Tax=Hymenobacter sp. BT770 TaxID=2886942 RepID=UPI001D12CA4F|nr:hypothetical protein [Hymenobacter sp. BT770]MCC3155439.1 hypothetical protein [Hymenobacter sp. BT770]MDO3414196.1 hypothetical protein [Hymenobacter sp. BT770]
MFLIDTLIIFVVGSLVFAPITGYIAASHGRSFWRWFGLGIVLPFFSVFVALFVAVRTQLAEKKEAGDLPKPPVAD